MGRRLDWPTCLKPRISVQNLCDSSMLRTLITRWLMPPGVTASAGAAGATEEVPSAIVVSPRCRKLPLCPTIWRRRGICQSGREPSCRSFAFHPSAPKLLDSLLRVEIGSSAKTSRLFLFDDLVGTGEQGLRHRKAERLGGFQVDEELKSRGLLHGQFSGLCTLQDPIHVNRRAASHRMLVNPIGDKTS